MANQSILHRISPMAAICSGTLLIAAALGMAIVNHSLGEVIVRADGLAHLVLVKDVAEIRQIEIVNRTGRNISLHGAQGWG